MSNDHTKSAIAQAMEILGGRVEDVAVICRVGAPTVTLWLKKGRVSWARDAIRIAQATAKKGQPVTVEALCGL